MKRQKNGFLAVYDGGYGETMHPGGAPWEEATRLYVAGGALAALLAHLPAAERKTPLVVFDVGLGAAANALAALACRRELQKRRLAVRPLRLISFEHRLDALAFAVENAEALSYPRGQEPLLRELLEHGRAAPCEEVEWELRLGNFADLIEEEPARAELVFFDPFSPRSNPEMWSLPVLEALYRCRRPGEVMRLVTYSASFAARAGLLLSGFFAGEGPALPSRRNTTVAATAFSALERPLGPGWLARWRREKEPWPPLTQTAAHRRLREALLGHPQWSHFPAGTAGRGPSRGKGHRGARGKPGVRKPGRSKARRADGIPSRGRPFRSRQAS